MPAGKCKINLLPAIGVGMLGYRVFGKVNEQAVSYRNLIRLSCLKLPITVCTYPKGGAFTTKLVPIAIVMEKLNFR